MTGMHVTKEEFIEATKKATSVNDLCKILGRSKPSVYTYAHRLDVKLKGIYTSGIRKQDGYYHYGNPNNHRFIMEKHLGYKLKRSEAVHHIDGDKSNNDLTNLIVMNWSDHQKSHKSLELIALELFKQGLVDFNSDTGLYNLKKVK